MKCPDYVSSDFVNMVLKEDIGRGDITTRLIFSSKKDGRASVKAKEKLVLCGVELAEYVFNFIDESLKITVNASDGEIIEEGTEIFSVSGDPVSILKGERTVLNFLQRLSGIATLTSKYVEKIDKNSKTKIVDTRKTTPGWRTLEKYAVRTGGASNHRFGLDDGIMIKDNHITMAGSITEAVKCVRKGAHHLMKIEVETTCLDEVAEALASKVDVIMLDNMPVKEMKKAVGIINRKAVVEISGGVTLEKIHSLSLIGADLISVGALTHSATAKDINLTLEI